MKTRYFAIMAGFVFLFIGVIGFVPGLLSLPSGAPGLTVSTGYGYLFGWLPINIVHNIVHLTVGILGVVAFRRFSSAQIFARGLTIFYAFLALLGLSPATYTAFGLVPLFGNAVWLHTVTVLIAAYFGYVTPEVRGISQPRTL